MTTPIEPAGLVNRESLLAWLEGQPRSFAMILARQYIKRIPADELERQISQAIAVYEAARTGDVKEAESQIREILPAGMADYGIALLYEAIGAAG